jgi:hypothetical protein
MMTILAEERLRPTPPMALVTRSTLMALSPLKVWATVKRYDSLISEVSLRKLISVCSSFRYRSMRSMVAFSLAKMMT